jgi:hypothetical protein
MTDFHKGEDGSVFIVVPNAASNTEQDYGYLVPLTKRAALEAANRIMHEPRPHNEDEVQLVAGYLILVLSETDD